MENPTCPKCGAAVESFMANKKGQLVGKCAGCGKWGNLVSGDKSKQTSEVPAKEGGKKEEPVKAAPEKAVKPATVKPVGNRRLESGKRVRTKPKPGPQPDAVAIPPKRARTLGDILEWLTG